MTNYNDDEIDYQNSSSPINYQDFIDDPNIINNNNNQQHAKSNRDESDEDQDQEQVDDEIY